MPFKSQAQRKKFYALAEEGKISKETLAKWEKETGDKKLPDKAKKKNKKIKLKKRVKKNKK